MESEQNMISMAVNHISTAIEQLDSGLKLSENECMQIISELKQLWIIDNRKEEKPSAMNINIDMDQLLEVYNNTAENTKKILQETLSIISNGKIPKDSDLETLNSSIDKLRGQYNAIYTLTQKIMSENDVVEENMPVNTYIEVLSSFINSRYEQQLEDIRKTLDEFIAVQSLVSHYSAALRPFQDQAKELIKKMSGENKPELENLDQDIQGPKVFMDALACKDIDSDEGIELLDAVSEFYPRRVQMGLAAGKYFLLEESSIKTDIKEEEGLSDTNNENNHVIVNRETDSNDIDIYGQNSDNKELSDFAGRISNSAGFLLDSDSEIGVLSINISEFENKKISSNIFRNEINNAKNPALKRISKEFVNSGDLTPRFFDLMDHIPREVVDASLQYLHKKGYIRKYRLSPGGEYFNISHRLIKAMESRNAAKVIGVKQTSSEEWDVDAPDTDTSCATRLAQLKVIYDRLEYFLNQGYYTFTRRKNVLFESFISEIDAINGETKLTDCVFGEFWRTTDECDNYYENLINTFDCEKSYDALIFVAFSKDRSNAFASIILDELQGKIKADNIYLYDFEHECYYDYLNGKQINFLDIGDESKECKDHLSSDELSPTNKEDAVITNEVETTEDIKEQSEDLPATINKSETNVEIPLNTINGYKKSNTKEKDLVTNSVDYNTFHENILYLISKGQLYAAVAYTKAFSLQNEDYSLFYNQLAYAINDPVARCNYSTNTVFNLIDNRGDLEDCLVISMALRTFFSNQVLYDYNIKSYYSGIKEYKVLNDYPALSKVLYMLMDFKNQHNKGLDAYAEYHSRNQNVLEQQIAKTERDADLFYNNFVIGKKKEKAKQRRFLETKKLIFSADSDFGQYIKAVSDGYTDLQPLVLDFLKENFYKDDSTIEEDTIDADKLWAFINDHWNEAGQKMMYRRHADLTSHLKSNIISITTKAVQLLVKWCNLVTRSNKHTEDEGDIAYKKIRKQLIENLEAAIKDMRLSREDEAVTSEERAGLLILSYTLREILECISGTYNEDNRKHFYVQFLLTDDLILDEDYLPDLEMHSSDLLSLQPMTRIWNHVTKVEHEMPSYRERLVSILDEKGDDYGEARLIADYLKTSNDSEELNDIYEAIESGEAYAKDTADFRRDDFIGNLELAQSYGQIDNSREDKKEKILQIIDEWYEWACDTSNYGFFNRVMEAYLTEIKEEAKSREKDLLEQLDSFKETTIPGLSAEAKNKRVIRIQNMIDQQNYTVAEDLLARIDSLEIEQERLREEDFLKDFLDNYDDYYRPVAVHNASFASLVSNRTRNKEQRGARRLAESWLPGGSKLGPTNLERWLTCMGFKVANVKTQLPIGKFEHFSVLTERAKGGVRDNYTHPIAAFGSGASTDGFRVVCINGAYDINSMIEIMKKIGNAKHTMILYDNALSKSDRRRLARKTKNALGDKLFVVVDRTVMMFMVRNYDETKMNKMLMALVTPFGYYQPYVWESANVMPPEIFMGRKQELERIKSPTGVNIVYGGRQLGKSALLKKAKEDIDGDENGNRAVLVDIKGLNHKQAANKIGHRLFDLSVLNEDIDTEDWNVLARAVRLRLQSDENRIPYLLLLLDEADVFIDSCAAVNYQPFDALKDIQSIGAGRFKFVIAGLRNIVRFKREALDNNSVLTHLEPMTVKPFNVTEARELMEIPLHYLGFRFPKEKESLITLILATTNYFPGLIQMYCAKLINALRNNDYANYDEVDTPIYEVSEEHIKKVLADPEFMQQIREKYVITLKLDEDNYYYLIALLMAYLYHNNGYNAGYSAEDIKNIGSELEISKISNLNNAKLESFMEELKELNVLRSTDESHYLFTRFTFFQMMGTGAEVDDKLEEYMGE